MTASRTWLRRKAGCRYPLGKWKVFQVHAYIIANMGGYKKPAVRITKRAFPAFRGFRGRTSARGFRCSVSPGASSGSKTATAISLLMRLQGSLVVEEVGTVPGLDVAHLERSRRPVSEQPIMADELQQQRLQVLYLGVGLVVGIGGGDGVGISVARARNSARCPPRGAWYLWRRPFRTSNLMKSLVTIFPGTSGGRR